MKKQFYVAVDKPVDQMTEEEKLQEEIAVLLAISQVSGRLAHKLSILAQKQK